MSLRGNGAPSTIARLAAVAGTAVLAVGAFLLGESWIIALTAALGWLPAVVAVTLVSSAGGCLIVYAFDAEESARGVSRTVQRIRRWIDNRRAFVESRVKGLAQFSGVLAFVVLSVTVGPFLTTVAIKIEGQTGWWGYALSAASSLLFSLTWVSVYAAGTGVARSVLWR